VRWRGGRLLGRLGADHGRGAALASGDDRKEGVWRCDVDGFRGAAVMGTAGAAVAAGVMKVRRRRGLGVRRQRGLGLWACSGWRRFWWCQSMEVAAGGSSGVVNVFFCFDLVMGLMGLSY
jgi:hypothetical protein